MRSRPHRVVLGAGLVIMLAGAVPEAQAQVRGLPVYNNGVPSGIALYGDVGFPDEEAGKGTAFGVSGRAGFGAFGATATLATFNPDSAGDNDVSLG